MGPVWAARPDNGPWEALGGGGGRPWAAVLVGRRGPHPPSSVHVDSRLWEGVTVVEQRLCPQSGGYVKGETARGQEGRAGRASDGCPFPAPPVRCLPKCQAGAVAVFGATRCPDRVLASGDGRCVKGGEGRTALVLEFLPTVTLLLTSRGSFHFLVRVTFLSTTFPCFLFPLMFSFSPPPNVHVLFILMSFPSHKDFPVINFSTTKHERDLNILVTTKTKK